MTYLGVFDEPPSGYRRMQCLCHHVDGCEVWAKGSLFSSDFAWCHVRKSGGD